MTLLDKVQRRQEIIDQKRKGLQAITDQLPGQKLALRKITDQLPGKLHSFVRTELTAEKFRSFMYSMADKVNLFLDGAC